MLTITPITRQYVSIDVASTLSTGAPAVISGVDVALVPPRSAPIGTTAWVSAAYSGGTATVLVAGYDADPTGALVVPAGQGADLWIRVVDSPEVTATKVFRILVLEGPSGAETVVSGTPFVTSVAGLTGIVGGPALVTAVGLGNVNNTSDANKPISTATQAALNTLVPINAVLPVVRAGVFTDSANPNSLTEYAATAGEQPTAVIVPYNYVTQPNVTALNAHHAAGREPLITWMPNGASSAIVDNAAYKLSNIIAGNFDAYMTAFLNTIKNLGYEVMIRWGTEMNGDWNPWSEKVNGNSAGQFALAWKHVVDLARSLGVTNVKWMWNPTTTFTTSIPLAGLWPGDGYVDLIGVDGYNWGTGGPGGLLSPSQLFDATFTEIAAFTTGKPLWIAEMGTQDTAGDKPAWITTFFDWLLAHHLAGFVWFNASVVENGGTYDWRVNSTTAVAAAFTAGMAKLRAATRPTGTVAYAAPDRDTAWHGVQDFTGAKVVGIPIPAQPLPTPAQIGAAPAVKTVNYFTADYTLASWNFPLTQVTFDGTTAQVLTVPPASALNVPVGSEIDVAQSGTGQVTVAAGAGVTVNSRGGLTKLAGRYAVAGLRKMDVNVWWLYGDLV